MEKPFLEILVQPQSKFRFRYKSEMTGKHGSLLGATCEVGCSSGVGGTTTPTPSTQQVVQVKVFPTVKVTSPLLMFE
jgi:hypothetical protein